MERLPRQQPIDTHLRARYNPLNGRQVRIGGRAKTGRNHVYLPGVPGQFQARFPLCMS